MSFGNFLSGFAGGTVGGAVVQLLLDADRFNAELKGAEGQLASTSSRTQKMATGVGLAWAAVGTTVTSFFADSISAAMEAEQVYAQTEAVVKSTGGAAQLTAQDMADLAKGFQRTTTFSDEAALSMMNVLATFKQVQGPQFREASRVILDMSTALGSDLQSTAIQVGKALNDPINGLTTLRRVGVSFTEQQKDMIKTMVETGDVMGAQRIILNELGSEFGGSAAAAADTFAGQMQMLRNEFEEFQEEVGTKALPLITQFVEEVKSEAHEVGLAWRAITEGRTFQLIDEQNVTAGQTTAEIQRIVARQNEELRSQFKQSGAAIRRFGNLSGETLAKWQKELKENFREAFGSISGFENQFTITSRQFIRNSNRMASQAQTFAGDVKKLMKIDVSESIKQALIDEGPAAIHAFVEADTQGRKTIVDNIKTRNQAMKDAERAINRATREVDKQNDALSKLDGKVAKVGIVAKYSIEGIDPRSLPGLGDG